MERMSSDYFYRGFQIDDGCWYVIISENIDRNTLKCTSEHAFTTNVLLSCKAFQHQFQEALSGNVVLPTCEDRLEDFTHAD